MKENSSFTAQNNNISETGARKASPYLKSASSKELKIVVPKEFEYIR